MLGLSCYILADTFFIANRLGVSGLAALNLAIPVFSFLSGSGMMLGIGGANRYSLLRGRGEKENAAFTHTIVMGVVVAAVFEIMGLFSTWVTALLGADEATFDLCRIYLRTFLLFAPVFVLNQIVIAFVRNDGAPQLAMAAMLGGSFSNILLDWILMYPLDMGILGAVLATCMAPAISLGILSPFFLRGKNQFHWIRGKLSGIMCRNIVIDGIPSLVTEVSSGIVMLLFKTVLQRLCGNDGVAAYGVISNISLVVLAMFNGIGQGIQPIVSRCHGRGEFSFTRQIMRYALLTVLLLSVSIYGLLFFGAAPIAGAFNSEDNTVMQALAVDGIRLYFTACPFAGVNIVLSAYLIASDRPHPANAVSLMRGIAVILPLTVLLSRCFGITGLWLAFPLTELTVAAVGVTQIGRKKV